MKRSCTEYCVIAALVFIASCACHSANLTWNASGGSWSSSGNWSPVDVPDSADDTLTFSTGGSGHINTNDISALQISSYKVIEGDHTTDLGENALTTTTFVVEGFTTAKTGTLSVVNGGSLTVTTTFSLGHGANADAHVLIDPGVALQVGNPSARAYMRVAENNGVSPSYGNASLVAGARFNAWLTDLSVGRRNSGYTLGITQGLLDLSAVTEPGVLDISGNALIGFDRFGSGTVIVSDSIDVKIGSPSIRGGVLRIGEVSNSTGTPASRLLLGTGRCDAYVTELVVGSGDTDGEFDAGAVSAGAMNISGNVHIGYNGQGVIHVVKVAFSDGMSTKIGDPATRVNMILGEGNGESGFLTVGTNRFEAYLNILRVGPGGGNTIRTVGALDLSKVTDGILDVASEVSMGTSRNSYATNILSGGFNTKIGDPSGRVPMTIGNGDRWRNLTFAAGGTFNAYLNSLIVGKRTTTFTALGHAILDLSTVTNGVLDIGSDMIVASGLSDGRATVLLPAIPVSAASLSVGTITNNSAYGLLVMTGTVFSVSGPVTLGPTSSSAYGRILTTVAGESAGLDLADEATLTVNQGYIDITFLNPERPSPVYWGLRWAGDHYSTLTNLYSTGKLTWDAGAVTNGISGDIGIFVKNNVTYVGAPGPSGTVITVR